MPQMVEIKIRFGAKSVRISFMIIGRTKFMPDGWFGLLQRYYCRLGTDNILGVEDAAIVGNR